MNMKDLNVKLYTFCVFRILRETWQANFSSQIFASKFEEVVTERTIKEI